MKSMTEAAGADVGDERKHRCRDEMKHSLKVGDKCQLFVESKVPFETMMTVGH